MAVHSPGSFAKSVLTVYLIMAAILIVKGEEIALTTREIQDSTTTFSELSTSDETGNTTIYPITTNYDFSTNTELTNESSTIGISTTENSTEKITTSVINLDSSTSSALSLNTTKKQNTSFETSTLEISNLVITTETAKESTPTSYISTLEISSPETTTKKNETPDSTTIEISSPETTTKENETHDSTTIEISSPETTTEKIETPDSTTIEILSPETTTKKNETPDSTTIEISSPETTTEKIETPDSTTIEISSPETTTKKIETPDSTTIEISSPETTTEKIETPDSTTIEISSPETTTKKIETPDSTTIEISSPETTTKKIETPDPTTMEIVFSEEITENIKTFNRSLESTTSKNIETPDLSTMKSSSVETTTSYRLTSDLPAMKNETSNSTEDVATNDPITIEMSTVEIETENYTAFDESTIEIMPPLNATVHSDNSSEAENDTEEIYTPDKQKESNDTNYDATNTIPFNATDEDKYLYTTPISFETNSGELNTTETTSEIRTTEEISETTEEPSTTSQALIPQVTQGTTFNYYYYNGWTSTTTTTTTTTTMNPLTSIPSNIVDESVNSTASDEELDSQIENEEEVIILTSSNYVATDILFQFNVTVHLSEQLNCSARIKYGDWIKDFTHDPNNGVVTEHRATHMFVNENEGNQTIEIYCYNLIANYTASDQVIVQRPVTDLKLVAVPLIVPLPPGNVNLLLEFEGNGYINQLLLLKWDYGEGDIITETFQNTDAMKSLSRSHHYQSSYSSVQISVNVSNMISYFMLNQEITVEKILVESHGDKLVAVKNKVLTEEIVTFELSFTGSSIAMMNISFGDNETEILPSRFGRFTHSYRYPGRYTTKVVIYNNVSSIEILCENSILVRRDLNSLTIEHPDSISISDKHFKISVTATQELLEMTCQVNISHLTISKYFESVSENAGIMSIDISMLTIGSYDVHTSCSDGVSRISFTNSVLLVEDISGFKMTLSDDIIQVGDMITVTLEITSGSDCSFAVSYGNGELDVIENNKLYANTFTYSYPGKGVFMVKGTAANSVSEKKLTETVKVIEPLKLIQFIHFSKDPYTWQIYSGGGDEQNKYNLNRRLIVQANDTSNSNLRYKYEIDMLGSMEMIETEEHQLEKKFNKAGNITIICTVTNEITSIVSTLSVEMIKPVKIVSFTNDGNSAAIAEGRRNVTFKMRLLNPSTKSCLFLSVGNNTLLWGMPICEDIYIMQAFIKSYTFVEAEISEEETFEEVYGINDTSNVEAIFFNEVSRSRQISQITAREERCNHPVLHVSKSEGGVEDPTVITVSKQLVIEGSAKISCEISTRASYLWSMNRIIRSELIGAYPNELVNASLTTDTSIFINSVVFPPHTLEIGSLYNISLTVSMMEAPLSATASAYIYVKPRPLELFFTDGNERVVGYNKNYVVDIYTQSKDTDSLDKIKAWTFDWICYREGEPRPVTDGAPLVNIPTAMTNTTALTDKGGCFGTGPGPLNISNLIGILNMNTNYSPINTTLIFEVTVTTPNNKVGKATHKIKTVPGDPPSIKIKCIKNCKSKINPTDFFSLRGRCEYCENAGLTLHYYWILSIYDSTVQQYIEDPNLSNLVVGTGSNKRSITFKENALAPNSTFRLKLGAHSHWSTSTYTLLEFSTTMPPYDGECDAFPKIGEALNTQFSILCKDWINAETETSAGLIYKIYRQDLETTQILLQTSTHSQIEGIILGPGDIGRNYSTKLIVDIENDLGALESVAISIQVLPPVVDEEEIDKRLEAAIGLLHEGSVQEATQRVQALATALNSNSVGTSSGTKTTESPRSENNVTNTRKLLRESVTTAVISNQPITMEGLQQTGSVLNALTVVEEEVSASILETTTTFIDNMAITLNQYTSGANGDPPPEKDSVSSAEGLFFSLANIVSATQSNHEKSIMSASNVLESYNSSLRLSEMTTPSALADVMDNYVTTTQSPESATTLVATIDALNEAINIASKVSTDVKAITNKISNSLLANQGAGRTPIKMSTKNQELQVARELAESAGNSSSKTKDGSIMIPSLSSFMGNNSLDVLDKKIVSTSNNPFSWAPSAKNMNSPVIDIILGDGNGNDLNVTDANEEFEIYLDISDTVPNPLVIQPYLTKNLTWGTVLSIDLTDDSGAIYLVITPDNISVSYNVCISFEVTPDPHMIDCSMIYTIPHEAYVENSLSEEELFEMRYSILITRADHYGQGTYHILIMEDRIINFDYVAPELEDPKVTRPPIVISDSNQFNSLLYQDLGENVYPWYEELPLPESVLFSKYTVQFVTPSCKFWNEAVHEWQSEGTRVGIKTNLRRVQCYSTHLTSFGSDFFVPPNTIDFGEAYSNLAAKLADNYAVLLTICLFIGMYIALAIWAHYKDKQDVKKWGVTPLEDNLENERYLYLITVTTGIQSKAGTSSNIFFNICGDRDETGIRKLSDGKRKLLTRGSQIRYVATSENLLGRMQTLRIWHDNTGKGDNAGWFLDNITVSDLQSGRTYAFLVNNWLAVDEDDGQIDRMIPVASPQELTAFSNLFISNSKKNITDGHLWISVFVRPFKSNYTRLQRLSVVTAVTFLTMVVNAMFYETEPVNVTTFDLGFFSITSFQLWVSIMGSFIVLPPTIIMDQIFRKARPKPTKTDPILQRLANKHKRLDEDDIKKSNVSGLEDEVDKYYTSSEIDSEDDEIVKEKKKLRKKMKKKQKKTFPWWVVYIGWTIIIIAIISSAFFVFSYSMQWGKEKSNSWLISMVLSVFQSVMIIQPLKVLIIAAIVAILLKKPDVEDLDEEERKMNGMAGEDETLVIDLPKKGKREKIEMKEISKVKLEKIRLRRLHEVEMLSLLKQIVIYAIYLLFLLFLAQQNRNSNAFYINENIKNMFAQHTSDNYEKFLKPASLIDYLRKKFVPSVYWVNDYNDDMVNWRNRPFMSDRVSFRVGTVRLRQIRIEPNACSVHPEMTSVGTKCNVEYSFDKEDKNRYKPGWKYAGNVTVPRTSPWAYRSMGRLDGAPVVGRLATYNGGGYAMDLFGEIEKIHLILDHLENEEWLDKYTRALFIEFGILNPYVNLFTRVCLMIEFSNTGMALFSNQINTIQLYSYVGSGAAWIIFCEIMVFVFIIVFLVRVCKKMKKTSKTYFKSFWNWMELVKVIFSIIAISMYMMKNAYVKLKLKDLADREGEFMNFHLLVLWNEMFIYLISFVCFVSILECLNLLRFNVKLSMLARTLRTCSKDLAAFSFTFITVFLAFAQFAFIAFSSTMQIYKGFITTCESMVGHLLGDLDMTTMRNTHGFFGIAFYITFVLLMMFIVINMFFSIMGDAFSTVKERLKHEKNEYELLEFVKGMIDDLMGWKKRKPISVFDEEDEEDEESVSKEEIEKKRFKESLLSSIPTIETTMYEAPPAVNYLSPEKTIDKKLPPLPTGSPSGLPVLENPLPMYYGSHNLRASQAPKIEESSPSRSSSVAGRGTTHLAVPISFQTDNAAISLPDLPTVPPNFNPDECLSAPVSYIPPPLSDSPSTQSETTLTDRPIDFLNLPPTPDNTTLYGTPWEIFFGRTSLRAVSSISPVAAKKPEKLPPIKADSVLCRLEDVENRLNEIIGDD